jgi:hypothetical protein
MNIEPLADVVSEVITPPLSSGPTVEDLLRVVEVLRITSLTQQDVEGF